MSIFRKRKHRHVSDEEYEEYEERPTIREWLYTYAGSLSENNSNDFIDSFAQWINKSRLRFWAVAILIVAFVLAFWALTMLIFGSPFNQSASNAEAVFQMNHSPGAVHA